MATDRTGVFAVPVAAALLLWPAVWNGFPIVFADTGTYLSQAIHRYAGWDRPVFYSLFILPLHATVTLWPIVVVQALLAAWIARLVCRVLIPNHSTATFIGCTGVLTVCTSLPWIVSAVMPDLFTPLLLLVLCLLAWIPERLSTIEQITLAGLATLMIASQQSSLPLGCVLLAILTASLRFFPWISLPLPDLSARRTTAASRKLDRTMTGNGRLSRHRRWMLIVLPPALAVLSLCSVNLAAHGQFTISPFGNVFLLARVIYDGPGMVALRRDCPKATWRLCPFLDSFPPTSDDFLWVQGGPLDWAGGAKVVSRDAGAIIQAAVVADPAGVAEAALANALEQLIRFDSGDGLNAWPQQISPIIEHDFPAREGAAYASARQQGGSLEVPVTLNHIHRIVALIGVAGCLLLLPVALKRRAAPAGFLLAVLLALPVSAAITGGLSAPHDRYQSRIMWLPPFICAISFLSLRRFRYADG